MRIFILFFWFGFAFAIGEYLRNYDNYYDKPSTQEMTSFPIKRQDEQNYDNYYDKPNTPEIASFPIKRQDVQNDILVPAAITTFIGSSIFFLLSLRVDAEWSNWSEWSSCSKSCGTGTHSRSRSCNFPTILLPGKGCVGDDKELQQCNSQPCPVNGGWQWQAWDCVDGRICSCLISGSLQQCPVGSRGRRTRKRICNTPYPSHGGAGCEGSDTQDVECPHDHVFTIASGPHDLLRC